MSTKKNEISAIKKLRAKKMRLKVEEQELFYELDQQVVYLYEHFGSLLFNTSWNAIKAQLPPVIQEMLPGGDKSKVRKTSEKEVSAFSKKYPHISALSDRIVDLAPVIYTGLKPILISFALKKAKKLLFK